MSFKVPIINEPGIVYQETFIANNVKETKWNILTFNPKYRS